MQIRFLELENFKSYAGMHRIGPFQGGVSCIIGPNGCGKSNVLDSLLFIFGFKSEKLRQDNLKSLIHKSSAALPSSCRVSVILETKEGQIKISRVISEYGYSYYYLNDSKCTLDQLKSILFDHGIDLRTNHFMILQGEIEKLAELGPKDLLAHMEYLFGSEPYVTEIEEISQRLGQLQISVYTFQNTIKIKRKALLEIRQARDHALSWAQCHIRLLRSEAEVLNMDVKHYTEKADSLARQLTVAQEEMHNEAQKQVNYSNDLRAIDELLPAKQRELKSHKSNYKKLEEEYNDIKLRLVSLKTNMEFKEKDFTTVYNKKEDLKDELQKMRNIDQEKQRPKLQTELNKVQDELNDRFSSEIIKRLGGVGRKREELTSKKEEFETVTKELNGLKATLVVAEKQLQQLDLLKREKEQTNSEIKAELNIRMNRMMKCKENLASYEETLAQLKSKTAEMTSARNVDSIANQLTKELKKASDNGILKGLHGRLRQYCWVERRYEKAFNTICPQLDYYIAETYDDALAATTYIKNIKLGRATFIVLEQLKGYPELERAMKNKFTAPQGSHRIYDLVQGDTYRNVLYWSVMDTLIVDDLQVAITIAYGARRYRVVTLNGDFIDISGTMTSAPPNRNSSTEDLQTLKSRQKLIQKLLEEEKSKLQKEEEELNNKKRLLEAVNTKRALLSDDPNFKAENYSAEEIKFMNQKLAILENDQRKLQTTLEKLQPELDNLLEGIDPSEIEQYLELKSNLDTFRAKLKAVESSESTCNKLQGRINVEQAKEKALQSEINRITSEQEICQNRKNLLDGVLQESMSRITHSELELSQLKEERKSLLQKLKNVDSSSYSEKIQKLSAAIEKARNDCRQAKEILVENQNQLQEYRDTAIEQIARMTSVEYDDFNRQSQLTMTQANRCVILRRDIDACSQAFCNDYKESKIQLSMLRERLEGIESKGPIDLQSIQQFNEASLALADEEDKLTLLKKEEETMCSKMQKLKELRLTTFLNGFSVVYEAVKGIYHELTKGDIDLSLVDALDPFSSGIELTVRPANKTWKKVNLLSGGEKTMTALALTFAFSRIRHCPFYLMDEIDAALDYRNTGILAKYIKNRQVSQMVVISLRRNMYEEALSLTGVYKINNCSRTLTVKVNDLNKIRICAIEGKLEEQDSQQQ